MCAERWLACTHLKTRQVQSGKHVTDNGGQRPACRARFFQALPAHPEAERKSRLGDTPGHKKSFAAVRMEASFSHAKKLSICTPAAPGLSGLGID